jgi:ABC-2 type transport system permease protein
VRGSSTALGEALQYLSLLRHIENFSRGVIDTSSLVYYVTLTALCLFLTLRTLDSMRWRRA